MRKINSGKGDEIGERGDSGRMEKKEKIGGKDFARLEETYRGEAWEEIDRDCKRSSAEEDEKELQLNSIKLQHPSGEKLKREKI